MRNRLELNVAGKQSNRLTYMGKKNIGQDMEQVLPHRPLVFRHGTVQAFHGDMYINMQFVKMAVMYI